MTAALSQPAVMKTKAIAQWFGSARMIGPAVGQELAGCTWAGVPFCGGCPELPHIKVRSGIASDLHRHLVNMARVIREPELKDELKARLDATLFHPDELRAAQFRCQVREAKAEQATGLFAMPGETADAADVDWAYDYFVCSWMGSGARSGVDSEFGQSISFRWNANGGDSCTRFRSAAESLDAWSLALRPWNFVCLNAFEFLDTVKDEDGHGIYCDPPSWPGASDAYRHKFTDADHRRLRDRLAAFTRARVVVRYGRHPVIEDLYPRDRWYWRELTGRNQANSDSNEVLLLNGTSRAGGGA